MVAKSGGLEIFSRNFLRHSLKLCKSIHTCMLYGETGKRHPKCAIEKRMAIIVLKMISQKKNIKNNMNTTSWPSKIRFIVDKCGRSDV